MPRKHKGTRIKPRKRKYGKLKDKHSRIMPIPLQIHTFKRIFRSANPHLEDPDAEMDNIDWESILQDNFEFAENLQNLEEEYPQYNWRVPKKERREKPTWQSEDSDDSVVYTTEVVIKPHEVNR